MEPAANAWHSWQCPCFQDTGKEPNMGLNCGALLIMSTAATEHQPHPCQKRNLGEREPHTLSSSLPSHPEVCRNNSFHFPKASLSVRGKNKLVILFLQVKRTLGSDPSLTPHLEVSLNLSEISQFYTPGKHGPRYLRDLGIRNVASKPQPCSCKWGLNPQPH